LLVWAARLLEAVGVTERFPLAIISFKRTSTAFPVAVIIFPERAVSFPLFVLFKFFKGPIIAFKPVVWAIGAFFIFLLESFKRPFCRSPFRAICTQLIRSVFR